MKNIHATDIKGQFNIGIVVSRFNVEITDKLLTGAVTRLKELDFSDDQVTIAWVPGAVEIPLLAKRMAESKKYDAIVCLGAVIQGETRHFDYVCEQVSNGCQKVALDSDVPVIFGVLTTNDAEQAHERVGGSHGHKGREAIDTAFEMVSVLRQIES